MMNKLKLKSKLWFWFMGTVIKYPEGDMYNLPMRILFTIIFPIKVLYYRIQKQEGYQLRNDTWIIHGIEYSDAIFKHFTFGDDKSYKIIKREDGIITIQTQNQKNDILKELLKLFYESATGIHFGYKEDASIRCLKGIKFENKLRKYMPTK